MLSNSFFITLTATRIELLQVDAALSLTPGNGELLKLKKDLQVSASPQNHIICNE